MVVTCPGCGTRFELEENLILRETARVRCSRCQYTFTVRRPDPLPEVAASPAADGSDAAGTAVVPPTQGEDSGPAASPPDAPAPLSPPASPRRRRWALGALTLMLLGLASGGAVWQWGERLGFGTPRTRAPLAKLPPPPLASAELQELKIELGEARFHGLENAKGGRLLVLTGEVVNLGPTARGPVRLKATLVDLHHREAASCLAFAGSTFTDQELASLAPEEINRWLNSAGGRTGVGILAPHTRQPFTIVFFGVPANLAQGGYGFTLTVAEAPPAAQP